MPGNFLEADLDIFFNPDELGDTALHNGHTFYGQFNAPFEAIHSDMGMIETTDPTFIMKTSDVTALELAHGNILEIDTIEYVIQGIEPGDAGITTLTLRPK